MSIRDSKNNNKKVIALATQAISTNTTTAGVEIDMQGYSSLTFDIIAGAITDGDYTPLIQESDTSGSGYTNVADDFLIGTEAEATVDATSEVKTIGYTGDKRYVKLSIVSTSVTTGGTITGLASLGSPLVAPVTQ
jgi:hypothetical protein